MNCHAFQQHLDEYLEGALAGLEYDAAAAHLQHCTDCQRRLARAQGLRAALRSLPIPPPRSGFLEQALAGAQRPQRIRHLGWAFATGAALAASLALWISLTPAPGLFAPATKPAGVVIALHETRTLQLAFNAERDLPHATLSIVLPAGVELRGFPGQHRISWQADIVRGANVLSLPLVAVSASDGKLLARLEQGERSTELTIPLHIDNSTPTSALPLTHAALERGSRYARETTSA